MNGRVCLHHLWRDSLLIGVAKRGVTCFLVRVVRCGKIVRFGWESRILMALVATGSRASGRLGRVDIHVMFDR
jgi:hypothetical protein